MTRHLGLVATSATAYNEPYNVARTLASLDHLTGGRAGWNLVTGGSYEDAANFSQPAHAAHSDRYERGEEFVDVVRGLWGSYDRDAFPRDKASGRYVDPAKVHEMPSTADAPDVDAGAVAYSDAVRMFGSGEFDVMMLGVGPDGHIASLFPGFPQLDVDDRIAVGVTDSPKPPPERISLTFDALNRSKSVWFLVSGDQKADAVARAHAEGTDRHDCPAAGVSGTEETIWFLDRDAASRL